MLLVKVSACSMLSMRVGISVRIKYTPRCLALGKDSAVFFSTLIARWYGRLFC